MSFMQKQITIKQRWLRVETNQGTEFVNVYDTGLDWPNSESAIWDATNKMEYALEQLQNYCEGEPESWENIEGYGARLSASGYTDCTEWAVFDTEKEAEEYLEEMYGEEEEED